MIAESRLAPEARGSSRALCLVRALACAAMLGCGAVAPAAAASADVTRPAIPKAWLQQKVTVAEAEAAHPGITGERAVRFPEAAKPFGFQHRAWEDLKALMLAGDELWTFTSPSNSWRDLAGRAGIALVRSGVPVKVIVTTMN
jgi:hypothetical protein